jgi:hypothetical protein
VAASLGLSAGLLTGDLYSAVIVTVALTTVIAPLLLDRFASPQSDPKPA